jgi:hypothetical protein
VEFEWVANTLSAYRNGTFLWKHEDPLYNATLLTAVSKSQLLLTNITHYFIYDVINAKVVSAQKGQVLAFAHQQDKVFVQTETDVVTFDRKSLNVSQYTGRSHFFLQKRGIVNVSNLTFALPHGYTEQCSAISQYGGILIAAKNGQKVVVAVLDIHRHVKSLVQTDRSVIGTCWAYEDALIVSYYSQGKKVAYVTSFGLTNTSTRTYTTESLIVAAGRDRFLFDTGRIAKVDGMTFHPRPGMAGGPPPDVQPDIHAQLLEGAYPGTKVLVDSHGCLALQGYDLIVLQGAGDDNYVTMHLGITGLAVVIAIALFVNSYQSRKTSFWQ